MEHSNQSFLKIAIKTILNIILGALGFIVGILLGAIAGIIFGSIMCSTIGISISDILIKNSYTKD